MNDHIAIAFNIKENDPLTKEQLDIIEEYKSGKGTDYMKVSLDDPRFFDYVILYERMKNREMPDELK